LHAFPYSRVSLAHLPDTRATQVDEEGCEEEQEGVLRVWYDLGKKRV
jgi:hypothetical protein